MGDISGILYQASVWVIPVLIAVTVHEAAHGWVANKLGDDTAFRLGRVTFNPFKHIDLFGTIILPGLLIFIGAPFLFGYAKPVPVNFARLRSPKRDMIWVALAGPGANIILACAAAGLLHAAALFPEGFANWWVEAFSRALILNIMLAVFNMLPLPPLDGGRVVTGLLPRAYAIRFARIERFGMVILLALLFVLPMLGEQFGVSLSPLLWIVIPVVDAILSVIVMIFGLG